MKKLYELKRDFEALKQQTIPEQDIIIQIVDPDDNTIIYDQWTVGKGISKLIEISREEKKEHCLNINLYKS